MNGERRDVSGNKIVGKNYLKRLYRSVKVIAWSIVPPRREDNGKAPLEEIVSRTPYILATDKEIKFYLADLGGGVVMLGEMKLRFTGCLAIAAPFILFRLKRCGFSNCRALVTGEGLTLSFSR